MLAGCGHLFKTQYVDLKYIWLSTYLYKLLILVSLLFAGLHWMPLYTPEKIVRNSKSLFWRNSWVAPFTAKVIVWLSMPSVSWQTSRSVRTLYYQILFCSLIFKLVYVHLFWTLIISLVSILFIVVKHLQSFSGNYFNRLHRSVQVIFKFFKQWML